MKHNVYFGLLLRIVILFTIGICGTYIPSLLPNTFFDDKVTKSAYGYEYIQWGARHYWYFFGAVSIFILSLVNCVMSSIRIIQKEYGEIAR